MKKIFTIFFLFFVSVTLWAQKHKVQGKVFDGTTPLSGAIVSVEGIFQQTKTNPSGEFELVLEPGTYVLNFSKAEYNSKKISLELNKDIVLDLVILTPDEVNQAITNVISLSENELEDDEGSADMISGFLQSSKDVYYRVASYDFGQVFYRPRGYDSKDATLLVNGVLMNKVETGRPQWSNWGGLNDVTRSQITVQGVGASDLDFGGAFGSTFINVRPSENRSGLRLSATASNRTYTGRTMATYNSGIKSSGFGYMLSGSRRWANDLGYIDGMLYNSYAFAAGLEYKASPYYSVNLVGLYSYNNRGKSAPLTQEAIALGGRHYNPNWGYINGDVRNAKMKRIAEPIFILSQEYSKKDTKIKLNLGYQFGQIGDTRIQYVKSQNPDPVYYTNMPTYYYAMYDPTNPTTNDPLALNKVARQIEYFRANKQLNWTDLYTANHNAGGESLYVLNEDVIDSKTLTANAAFSTKLNNNIWFDSSLSYQNIQTENYQQINDLLGGQYFLNKSYYSGLWYNDYNTVLAEGDKYQYHYNINVQKANAFGQLRFKYSRVDMYVAGKFDHTSYQRDGRFANIGVYTDSEGRSGVKFFNTISTKAGITYSITGRHFLQFNTGYFELPQNVNAIFTNVRNSNSLIPYDIKSEKQITADASYLIRMPYFKARLTGYITKFEDAMEKSYFFTQARLGDESAGFITQTMAGVDRLHFGGEFGAEVQIIPTLKATAVASVNQYTYTNNPTLFQSSDKLLVSSPMTTYIKDYRYAAGPQHAYSVGLEYRDPHYWWLGVTANWLDHNYVSIAPNQRTANIYIDPNTGTPITTIDQNLVKKLLRQERLEDLFLLNLSAGKSWRVKGKYISTFVSVNNLLNKQFKTGGFEQARKGNYTDMVKDNKNGYPTFGNKYFVGYGTTYFVNLALSL